MLVEEHREELTKLAEVDVVPLVDREVNRVFKHRQIQVRYAGNFVHESGGRLRPFGNPDTDERMERTQEFLRQELLHGERHSVLASRFPDYADFLSHLVGELRRQGIKIAK